MQNEIKKIVESFDCKYIQIDNLDSLEIIYNLLIGHKTVVDSELTSIEGFYFGFYYKNIEKDYALMKKYYLMAIEHNNSAAMINLGVYYGKIEKDYTLMKKYYLTAIEHNNSSAMNNLAVYYKNIENYILMKKYYLMAIEHNNSTEVNNLQIYYENNTDDFSFLELYVNARFYENAIKLINTRFKYNVTLPNEYKTTFFRLKLGNDIENVVKMKQYILKKTNVFPSKYSDGCMLQFMELLFLSSSPHCIFCKDLLMKISSYLFI